MYSNFNNAIVKQIVKQIYFTNMVMILYTMLILNSSDG